MGRVMLSNPFYHSGPCHFRLNIRTFDQLRNVQPMPGQLFTHYFLTDGIKATPEWQASPDQPEVFTAFRDDVYQRYEALSRSQAPNEATTEQELIRPVLELLGWVDYLPQQGVARNEDIPDHLLFADASAKQQASAKKKPADRYRDALVVQESKRFGLALDTHDKDDRIRSGTPHRQILRYLSTAEIASDSRIRWGILTNGSVWRLYDYRARPRDNGYFEADLADLLKPGKEDELRVFYLLFRRESFVHQKGATATFLERALAEGKRYEEQVAEDLSQVVFGRVFPDLVDALATHSKKKPEREPGCRPHFFVSPAVCALCRGPGVAAGQRLRGTTIMVCASAYGMILPGEWTKGMCIPPKPLNTTIT